MSLSKKSFSLLQRDMFLFTTGILTSVVIARKLGPESMGLWAILQLIVAYSESFGRMKFDIASVYYIGKGIYSIGEVAFILNVLSIISGIIIVAPICINFDVFYNFLFRNSGADIRGLVWIILLQIPVHFLSMNYSYLFIAKEDISTYNRIVIIKALCSSLFAIIPLVFFNAGLQAVVYASFLATTLGLLYGMVKLSKTEKMKPNWNMSMIRDLASYGAKFYFAGIIGHFNYYITNLITALYLAPAQVAFFSMAQSRGELMNKIPNAVNTVLFPRISKSDSPDDSVKLTLKAFRVTLLMLIVSGFLLLILIKPLVFILYGREFFPMVLPFMIMLPGLISSGSTSIIYQYFGGIGRADILPKIALFPLAIQVTMAMILIPVWGLTGAAFAFSISLLISSLVILFVFTKISSIPMRDTFCIRKEDIKILADFVLSYIGKFKMVLLRSKSAIW